MLRRIIAYCMTVVLLLQSMGLTIGAVIIGLTTMSASFAATTDPDTPTLNQLKTKYLLDDPERNHKSDVLPPSVSATIGSPPASKDQTGAIVNVLTSTTPTRDLDLATKYPGTTTFNDQIDMALNIGQTQGQPSGTIVGNQISTLDMEYARAGTRKFVRNPETGEMEIKTVESIPRASGLDNVDMFSHEINNTHYDFEQNKQSMYGDDAAIYDEAKIIHEGFKDQTSGQTGAGRSYRLLTKSAMQANGTVIQETEGWLTPSFDALQEANDPSQWIDACTETTVTTSNDFNYTTTTEVDCQDTSQSKLDYCQVERILEPLILIESANGVAITPCGPGCIDIEIGDKTDNWASGNCEVTNLNANLTINDRYPISAVTLTESAIDDHAILSINGDDVWSVINGTAGSGGSFSSVTKCELKRTWKPTHTGDLQAAMIAAQSTPSGVANFNFDLLVADRGEAYLKFRVRFDDPSGNNFNGEFIQEPEGCYDALTPTAKVLNPLEGIYDDADLLPSSTYFCSAPRREISCLSGYVPIDSGNSQDCFQEAIETPVCPEGSYNEITSMCEVEGIYFCPVSSGHSCGTSVSFAEVATLVDDQCIYTDAEHCGAGWSITTPAAFSCPLESVFLDGVCVIEPATEFICPDEVAPITVTVDGEAFHYCEEAPRIRPVVSDQEWSCASGQNFDSTRCDITRGDSTDSALCYTSDVDPDYIHPESFCTFDSYSAIEVGDRGLSADFLSTVPPFYPGDTGEKTWIVNLDNYRCDPTDGSLRCVTDPVTGEVSCMTWEELRALPNQCQPYIDDPLCSEKSRECTEGWLEEQTDRCMASDVVYTCAQEHTVAYSTDETTNVCTGMLPCSGGDCTIGTTEKNERFVEAMVAGSIADNMDSDTTCEVPTDPSTCEIFPGEFEYCSWEVSGLGMDCCEEASGVDVITYILTARHLMKLNQYIDAGAFGDGVAGGYKAFKEPITDATQTITNWASDGIRHASETLFGNTESVSGGVSAVSEGIEAALSTVQQAAYELIYDIAPDTLREFLFSNAADYASGRAQTLVVNEAITNTLSTIMAVYTAYNMAKLALTLLTACDDNEIDMSVKLAQRQCFTVGSRYCSADVLGVCYQRRQNHCCYSSILARIIAKEALNQLSIDPLPYGNRPSTPAQVDASCPGITPAQLAQIDFNAPSMQLALQEWVGLMFEADIIPQSTDEEFLSGPAQIVESSCPDEQVPVVQCYRDARGAEVCEHARDGSGRLLYDMVPGDCAKQVVGGQIFNAQDRVSPTERLTGSGGYIQGAERRVQETDNLMRTLPG